MREYVDEELTEAVLATQIDAVTVASNTAPCHFWRTESRRKGRNAFGNRDSCELEMVTLSRRTIPISSNEATPSNREEPYRETCVDTEQAETRTSSR